MNLRSGHGSTSAGVDSGDNGHGEGIGNTNGESHEAPLLAPPPSPPPPPMTHAEMMAEMLATRRESARALEMLAKVIGGFARGGPGGNSRNGGGQEDVLSLFGWTAVLSVSAGLPGTSHLESCAYSAGATAALGTAGSALSGIGEQVWCLFQVWQEGPLCSGVSTELAYAVFLAFSQLSSG